MNTKSKHPIELILLITYKCERAFFYIEIRFRDAKHFVLYLIDLRVGQMNEHNRSCRTIKTTVIDHAIQFMHSISFCRLHDEPSRYCKSDSTGTNRRAHCTHTQWSLVKPIFVFNNRRSTKSMCQNLILNSWLNRKMTNSFRKFS